MSQTHKVQPGDSVIQLSDLHGFFAPTIWQHADNAALRALRPDMNQLLPGDTVVIPDKRQREERRATGASHSFRRKGIPAKLRLQLHDMHWPRADQPFELSVDGGPVQTGRTDADGVLEAYVPARARQGELVVGDDRLRLQLQFGHQDPHDAPSGMQKRLLNLGYLDADGADALRSALLRFQREHGLPCSGDADTATADKLREVYDAAFTYAGGGAA